MWVCAPLSYSWSGIRTGQCYQVALGGGRSTVISARKQKGKTPKATGIEGCFTWGCAAAKAAAGKLLM